jgi:hypothetical protein
VAVLVGARHALLVGIGPTKEYSEAATAKTQKPRGSTNAFIAPRLQWVATVASTTEALLKLLPMDFPEQSVPNEKIARAIERNLKIRVGFGTCALCAKEARSSRYSCKECERVDYCSNSCQGKDKFGAGSHTEMVCSILRDCSADEEVAVQEASGGTVDDDEAADRVRSERESYPATVANVLTSFECFDHVLRSSSGKSLTMHLVGASEAELWSKGDPSAVQAYEDALRELVGEQYNIASLNLLFVGPECPPVPSAAKVRAAGNTNCTVRLQTSTDMYDDAFLTKEGAPDIVVLFNPGFTCPDYTWLEALRYAYALLILILIRYSYATHTLLILCAYPAAHTLLILYSYFISTLRCIPMNTPFFVATNTEMEAFMEVSTHAYYTF